MVFVCQHCGQYCKAEKGLTQHIQQKPECRTKENAKLGLTSHGVAKRMAPRKAPPKEPPKRPGMEGGGFATYRKRKEPPKEPPKRPGMEGGGFATYRKRTTPFVGKTRPFHLETSVLPPRKKVNPPKQRQDDPFENGGITEKELPSYTDKLTEIADEDHQAWKELEARTEGGGQHRSRQNHQGRVDEPRVETIPLADEEDDNGWEFDDNESGDGLANESDHDPVNGYQDDDFVEGEDDFNNDGHINIDVNKTMRNNFDQYCEEFDENFMPYLTKEEKRGIRLMDIMKRKRCSLDTYDEIMLWFLRETGKLDDDETLADARHSGYISI